MTPDHLGGHLNRTHVDEGALDYVLRNYDIRTMIDIGCGPGGMVDLARSKGILCIGVDGDPNMEKPWVIIHDYTIGPLFLTFKANQWFDLGWCIEFVEHVEEQYVANFVDTFKHCRYLVMTAAPPGWGGHHHVNLQNFPYWKKIMEDAGFRWDSEATTRIRQQSTMTKGFMARTGAFYENLNTAG